jgi:hypothetical protein
MPSQNQYLEKIRIPPKQELRDLLFNNALKKKRHSGKGKKKVF